MNTMSVKRLSALAAALFIMLALVAFPVFATEDVADETNVSYPGYVKYVISGMDEAPESVSEDEYFDYAMSYVDAYDDAIQNDADVEENYAEAISIIRANSSHRYATFWSVIPPIIAIALALLTKEVYSSLFIGILAGGLLYANFNFEGTLNHVVEAGFVTSLADSYNVGILIFLVILGAMVAMMNKAGGSAAFGKWASKNIRTRVGAQIATILLGCLIFVDDYFNCLTVGSVMRPVTDANKVSRAKLSYLIDSTAAPICIIAPVSSWAAAVAGFADGSGMNGLELFVSAIPFNFYALLTIVMMFTLSIGQFDYGPMKLHEKNAMEKGDLFTFGGNVDNGETQCKTTKGKVIDLVIPVVILIICCVICMTYSGGIFDPESDAYGNFVTAFSNCDASVGLALGSVIALVINIIYFLVARFGLLKFSDIMDSLPEGFKAMVPAILILTFAWTLKGMTDSLGAKVFIADIVRTSAGSFMAFLPAIIFLIAVGLSFSTGTSWGTFGILIPIVLSAFGGFDSKLTIVAISACMAGAVCGDHCSPISDTTIMSSAGAQCNHINHVSTQLPYALTVAAVSFVSYIIAGFVPNALIVLPIAIVLMIGTLLVIKSITAKKL